MSENQKKNTDDAMDLVSGYEEYTEAEELDVDAAADAPATTVPCSVVGTVYVTINEGC